MNTSRLLAVLLLATPAVAADPARIADIPQFEGLAERWQEAMEAMDVPGFAVGVVKDGRILALDAWGVRNPAGDPVDPDTIFYIASCTKTYVAADLALLAEQGHVDLDRPVRSYLPRFRLADDAATDGITVRDLLCHRPGLDSGPIVFLDAYTGEITEDRYYHWLAAVEPTGEVEYSNLHFTLAGRVIEAVTGRPWKDDLDERLLTPAGLHRTTAYASRMYGDANAAIPMEKSGDDFVACRTRKTDHTMHAAGGMGTSARDGARWLQLQLGDGAIDGRSIVAGETVVGTRTRQSDSKPRGRIRRLDGFGLGWMLGTYRDRPYVTHGGGYIGTAAHLSFLPEHGLGVVLLANGAPSGQAMMDVVSIDIYDRLLGEADHGDLLPRYIERIAEFRERRGATPDDDLVAAGALSQAPQTYTGRYENPNWGTFHVAKRDGELRGRIGDLTLRLVSTGADAFAGRTEGMGDGYEGRFVIEDGRVVAVVCEDEEDSMRFERAAGP